MLSGQCGGFHTWGQRADCFMTDSTQTWTTVSSSAKRQKKKDGGAAVGKPVRARQPFLGTTWTLPWAGKKCRGLQKENDWPCLLPPRGCGCPSNRAERRECFICGRLRSDNGGKSLSSTKAASPSGGGSGHGGKRQVATHSDGENFVNNGGSDLVTFLAEKAKAFSSNPPSAKMQAFAPKLTPGASVLASMFNLTPMDGVGETA